MKNRRRPIPRPALAALALSSLLAASRSPAQVLDSMLPEMAPVGSEKPEVEPAKDYRPKGPGATWSAHRMSSTYVFVDLMPKLGEILAKSSPATADEQTWRSLGGRAGMAWDDSRKYKPSGERPADQDEWEKQNRDFLKSLLDDGALLVSWRQLRTARAGELQKAADDAPARFEEIRKTVEAVDSIWKDAKKYALDGETGMKKVDLEKAREAYAALRDKRSVVEAAYGAARTAYSYAKTENALKPSIDPYLKEKASLKRWRNAVAEFPKVDKQYPGFLSHWAALAETGFQAEVKAWEAMQKAFEPITSFKLLSGTAGGMCAVDRRASECIQPTLDLLAKTLAGAGTALAADEAKLKEDTDLTARERARWFELLRKVDAVKEARLLRAVDQAESEDAKRAAEKDLKGYRDLVKASQTEMDEIQKTHRERRKKLGLPPEEWA
jgi:hypothetical protein